MEKFTIYLIITNLAFILINVPKPATGIEQSSALVDNGDQKLSTTINSNNRNNILNKHVIHFEPLDYDHYHVHRRAKRDLEEQNCNQDTCSRSNQNNDNTKTSPTDKFPIKLDFKAHNRNFKLKLKPDVKSVFSDKIVIENGQGDSIRDHIDHDLFSLTGHVQEYPHHSLVYGSLKNGIFEGKIQTHDNEVFYVERARKYIDDLKSHNPKFQNITNHKDLNFHSVIYSADDVIHPHYDHPPMACLAESHQHEDSHPVEEEEEEEKEKIEKRRAKRDADFYNLNLYKEPAKRISSGTPGEVPQRQKRACTLYIQTDTYLWNHTRRHHDNDLDTREEIASLVAQHIKAVNHIYENSDFGGIRGLKFIVQRLRINDTQACEGTRRQTNPFCPSNIDVSNFLNLNSQFNHNDFCLAYIFTYRDFTGGTLGLAWVASTSGASGGICEKYKSYTENQNGKQVQTKRSLNTGIITFVNYNSRVPPKVSELTLAHEIGHNFGSPHDFPPECRPGGSQGNFIMYSSATSGERSNNNKFSNCSMRNITNVLHSVISGDEKNNCFEEDDGPFCGNKIVEEGEECDCGYNAQECTEQCCVPREFSGFDTYGGSTSCQRIRGKQCSPSEGPCCSDDCTFAGYDKMCRLETECSHSQTCDHTQSSCPAPSPKPNMTECNNGTQVCMNGKCEGSICKKYGMEECFLTSKTGAKPEDMCEVACQQQDKPTTCKRTSEIPEMRHMSGLKLRPGSPCDDFLGYCDVFQICRQVDTDGPLARLKSKVFNQRTLTSIKQWAIIHWWVCALAAIGFMMLMYIFIQCCAVHTPSSNPNKRPALKISDTIRHPTHTLRRKRRSHNNHNNHSSHHRPSSHPHSHHHRQHRSGGGGGTRHHRSGPSSGPGGQPGPSNHIHSHHGRSHRPRITTIDAASGSSSGGASARPRDGYLFSA